MMKLLSVQVGQVQTLPRFPADDPAAAEWRSAIVKEPVQGKVRVGAEGLAGDAQQDRRNHGGVQQAINVYPFEHYAYWQTLPGLQAMTGGAFGENFTTLGLLEDTVCIGDLYRVGEGPDAALVEVSQPRQPCYKLARRWQFAGLDQRAEAEGRTGWYFRVKQEGWVQAGDALTLLERPFPQWTVARVFALIHAPHDRAALAALAGCEALSPGWRTAFQKKLA